MKCWWKSASFKAFYSTLRLQKLRHFLQTLQSCVQQTCNFAYSFYTSVLRHLLNFYNHFVRFTVSNLPLSLTIPLNPQQEYCSLINSRFFLSIIISHISNSIIQLSRNTKVVFNLVCTEQNYGFIEDKSKFAFE